MKAIVETKNEKNQKIANLQFVLSVLIVVIHANCLFFNLPGEELQYVYGNNYSTYIQLFGVSPLTSLLVYFLSIALTVMIIVAIGWVLKRWLKPVFKFICGGR